MAPSSLFILICISILPNILAQSAASTDAICKENKKCGLCLQNFGCVWCSDPKYSREAKDSNYDRCNTLRGHGNKCKQFVTQTPASLNQSRTIRPNPTSITSGDYHVTLSAGQAINITFNYADQGNKALDLYYLMDLSATMEKSKRAVSLLGAEFARVLKDTTSNLQMGFGSFVDKPMMPYATLYQTSQPWTAKDRPPYGFENHLNLTPVEHGSQLFENTVTNAKISYNLDAPEGGLDAMMQVMECEEIGWRKDAHRLLVVSTDGSFHIAGDGRLGGLVVPNDGKCHMFNNSYAGSTEYDYPSISQIISKIREKKIYIIFAVLNPVADLYQSLSKLVEEYAATIKIDARSEDVLELVKTQYGKIRSRVQLSATSIDGIQLKYFAKCEGFSDYVAADKCENLASEAKISFKVQIELRNCPANPNEWNPIMSITPTGSPESLQVKLNLKCGCDCENIDDTDTKTGDCSQGQGTLRCGICSCRPDYIGESCQCQKNSTESNVDESKCYSDTVLEACGGRGVCTCGQCDCKEPYTGDFCACDKSRCSCANSNHGKCICEKCECDEGYSGPNCDCSESKFCKGKDGQVCSNNGRCSCDRCDCNSKDFTGTYCQICQTCQCLEPSVLCSTVKLNKTHVTARENYGMHCVNGSTTNFTITEFSDQISIRNEAEERSCSADFQGCRLEYIFGYDKLDQRFLVRVKDALNCPKPAIPTNPLPIILGTIGSVLLLGILTLILWKIITYFLDKREFQKFERECKDGSWGVGVSPLYVEATSTFQNPAYTD